MSIIKKHHFHRISTLFIKGKEKQNRNFSTYIIHFALRYFFRLCIDAQHLDNSDILKTERKAVPNKIGFQYYVYLLGGIQLAFSKSNRKISI